MGDLVTVLEVWTTLLDVINQEQQRVSVYVQVHLLQSIGMYIPKFC